MSNLLIVVEGKMIEVYVNFSSLKKVLFYFHHVSVRGESQVINGFPGSAHDIITFSHNIKPQDFSSEYK